MADKLDEPFKTMQTKGGKVVFDEPVPRPKAKPKRKKGWVEKDLEKLDKHYDRKGKALAKKKGALGRLK